MKIGVASKPADNGAKSEALFWPVVIMVSGLLASVVWVFFLGYWAFRSIVQLFL